MRTTSGHFICNRIAVMRKEHQKPLKVEEQLANLKALNLIIEDDEYAEEILNDISYFRLIKAYSLGLKPKNGEYNENVSFNQIVNLYKFNANFRQLLFSIVERVEVNLRCRIANYFSVRYGVFGYEDQNNFENPQYHQLFLVDIQQEIGRNLKSPFVRNFQDNYDGRIPMYALVELFSFGTLSKFFKNMKNVDKKAIASIYGVGYTYLESWFESIAYVRNLCAHYGRIYNAKFTKKPMLYKQDIAIGADNGRMFAILLCISRLVKHDTHWIDFLDKMELIVEKYSIVDISTMGFPLEWKQYLK